MKLYEVTKTEDEDGDLIWDLPNGIYLIYNGNWGIYDWDGGWRFHTGIPKYVDIEPTSVFGPLPTKPTVEPSEAASWLFDD